MTERSDGGPCEHAADPDAIERWSSGRPGVLCICWTCGRRWNEPPIVVRQTAPARVYGGER